MICEICNREMKLSNNGKICDSCQQSYYHRKNKRKQLAYKNNQGCVLCGYNKCVSALEFHHINEKEKSFGIGKTNYAWEKVKQELDKTVVVCSNCHRKIHAALDKISFERRQTIFITNLDRKNINENIIATLGMTEDKKVIYKYKNEYLTLDELQERNLL